MDQKGQYLTQNDLKCKFWAKFGRFWAKNLNFCGSKYKFWYTFNVKNTKAPCLHCFFGRAWDQMGQKCRYLAKNASFGLDLAVLGPKFIIFIGVSKSFGTHITKTPPTQLVPIGFWLSIGYHGPKCQYLSKNVNHGPNLAVFGPKIHFENFDRCWFIGR